MSVGYMTVFKCCWHRHWTQRTAMFTWRWLSITQSDNQRNDTITIGESSNNCIAAAAAAAGDWCTRFPGDHSSVAVCHRRSMCPLRRCCLCPLCELAGPVRGTSTAVGPKIYAWFVLPNRRAAALGLWLTYPVRITVSRKTSLAVNRKVPLVEGTGETHATWSSGTDHSPLDQSRTDPRRGRMSDWLPLLCMPFADSLRRRQCCL